MIIVAKMVTVLTRRAHITVSVTQGTGRQWSPLDGSVTVKRQSHQDYDQVTPNLRFKSQTFALKLQKQRTTCLRGRG